MATTKGLDEVLGNINREVSGIENRGIDGLLEGGLMIQGRSQRKVPVEYGNLRASAYTRKSPDDPSAVDVGYSAAYALFVHENMEQKLAGEPRPSGLGEYWGPKGEPKFLESTVTDSASEFVEIVRRKAAVKS
jgi:hypothetical protein